VAAALQANQPVISVDTKKKELVGAYKNAGQEWLPIGEPGKVEGLIVSDAALATVNIERDAFHSDWNYCIRTELFC